MCFDLPVVIYNHIKMKGKKSGQTDIVIVIHVISNVLKNLNCFNIEVFYMRKEWRKKMCNLADRKSSVPPMDQPLQILNFCRPNDIIVFDGQQILDSESTYK
jgi:hypothetical protein